MSIRLLVVVFACSLVFYHCAADRNARVRTKKREFNYQDYQLRNIGTNDLLDIQDDGLREVSCSHEDFSNIGKGSGNECRYRKRIVPLKAPDTMDKLLALHPSHVEVNWCSGYCDYYSHGSMSCLPVKLKTIEIAVTAVMLKSPSKTESKCFIVKVQEHESCTCNCSTQEKHCNPEKQLYNKSRCRCECKDTKKQLKCEKKDRIWNPVKCECECATITSCSTGWMFNPESCSCARTVKKSQVDPKWQARLNINRKKIKPKRGHNL